MEELRRDLRLVWSREEMPRTGAHERRSGIMVSLSSIAPRTNDSR